jgi:hypothetical protein
LYIGALEVDHAGGILRRPKDQWSPPLRHLRQLVAKAGEWLPISIFVLKRRSA